MPYTMEEFIRKIHKEWIQEATLDERLEGVPPEQILQRLTPEQIFQGLTPEAREKFRTLFKDPPPV